VALNKQADSELADLIQQAAEELRATNPALFAESRPLADEEYAQILADAAKIERVERALGWLEGDDIMAIEKKANTEFADLLRRAVEEQRAVNPALFAEPRPLAEDVIEQLLRDEAELERTWDEMDRQRGHKPRRYTAEEVVSMDRGE
jgi:hypothetical protein